MDNEFTNYYIGNMSIHVGPRGCGKTREALKILIKDPESIIVLPTYDMARFYTKEFHIDRRRVFRMDQILLPEFETRLLDNKTVVIDEGLVTNLVTMAQLYYKLGYFRNVKLCVFGTQYFHERG